MFTAPLPWFDLLIRAKGIQFESCIVKAMTIEAASEVYVSTVWLTDFHLFDDIETAKRTLVCDFKKGVDYDFPSGGPDSISVDCFQTLVRKSTRPEVEPVRQLIEVIEGGKTLWRRAAERSTSGLGFTETVTREQYPSYKRCAKLIRNSTLDPIVIANIDRRMILLNAAFGDEC